MAKKKALAPYLTSDDQSDLSAIDAFLAQPMPQAEEQRGKRSLVRMGADAGISLLKGAVAVPEAAVGLADIATGGRVGKFLENEDGAIGFRPRQARMYLDSLYSPEQQQAFQRVQQADGVVDTAIEAVRNPSVIAHSVIESLPSIGAGGVVGRGVIAALPRVSGAVAGALGEGTVSAGQTAEQIRQESADGLLTPQQTAIAAGSGALTGGLGLAGGKLAERLGIADVDTLVAGAARHPEAAKGVVRRVLEGAASEGLLEELPQSVQEQVAQNLAQGRPLDEGVDQAAVLGTLSGGLMGAGVNALPRTPSARMATQPPPLPSGPMGRAVQAGINWETVNVPPPAPVEPSIAPAPAADGGIPFEADQRFAGKPVYPNGAAPAGQQYGSRQAADIALGEQALLGSHDVQETAPGVYEIRPNAAPDMRMVQPGIYDTGDQPPAAAPRTPLAMPSPELLRAGVDPATGELPPPAAPPAPPTAPPAPGERPTLRADDGSQRAVFGSRDEALEYIGQVRRQPRNAAIRAVPVERPDGSWTLANPGEPGYEGAALPPAIVDDGSDADVLNAEGKPFTTKRGAILAAKAKGEGWEPVKADGGGFVVRKRPMQASTEAVLSEPQVNAGAPATVAEGRSESLDQPPGAPAPSASVDASAHEASTSPHNDLAEPTPAQKEAGNYKMGHDSIGGLPISFENPAGSVRRGVDRDGKPWENELQHHYGYIRGTVGADKDHVDAFVKPGTARDWSGTAFVVDQVHPDTGKFDEHKALLGFDSADEAKAAYQSNYNVGWKGLHSISAMPMSEFKAWVTDPMNTKKPLVPIRPKRFQAKEDVSDAVIAAPAPLALPAPEQAQGEAPAAARGDAGQPAHAGPADAGVPADAQAGGVDGAWWDGADLAVRLDALKAAGWGFGKAGPSVKAQRMAATAWGDMTDSQRDRLTAARGAVPTPATDDEISTHEAAGHAAMMDGKPRKAPEGMATNAGDAWLKGWDAAFAKAEAGWRKAGRESVAESTQHRRAKAIADKQAENAPMLPAERPIELPKDVKDRLRAAGFGHANDAPLHWYAGTDEYPGIKGEDNAGEVALDFKSGDPLVANVRAEYMGKLVVEREATGIDDIMAAVDDYMRKLNEARQRVLARIRANKGQKGLPDENVVDGEAPAPKLEAPSIKQKLEQIAENLGVKVFKAAGGWHASGDSIEIPDDDVDVVATGAGNLTDVFAHELGHVVMLKRGVSFKGFPKAEMLRYAPNWDDLVAASKAFRPAVHDHENQRFRRHAMKPDEILADAIASVFTGKQPIALLKPLMDKMGWSERDLGLEAKAPAVDQPAAPAQTTDTEEKPDDSAAPTDAPALDRTLAEGLAGNDEPVRGAARPRTRTRRANDRSVRDQGGLFEGLSDDGGQVGDRGGAPELQHGSPDRVAGDRGRVSAPDFRAFGQPGALTREGTWYDTAARNVDLIELALKIESEGRPATPEEQAQLAKYVGFGASEIRNNLFPVPSAWAKQQQPHRLIWPDLTRDERWKALAERLEKLPEEWQRSVLQSTQYAHYTSEGVIRSIWSAMDRLGFTGGKILEPGMGIGSFAMLMPDSVHRTSKYTGIEFDGPTALIARLLSPEQNMLHDDFIKRRLPKDFFDVAIGNPPFSQTRVLADPDYEKHGFMLHDFFFAKSIDRVRPGGLLVFVTSKGTMDKQTDKARKYLAERADLLGAIRLPQTAFEGNAGTKVVTDVIFLRKRAPGEAAAGEAWAEVKGIDTKDGPTHVNEYFADHPEMVLGQQRLSGNRDDEDRYISGLRNLNEYTVVSYDKTPEELERKFAAAVELLPRNAFSVMKASTSTIKAETAKVDFDPKVRREGVIYKADDGTLMRVESGVGRSLDAGVKLSANDKTWLNAYVGLRDLVQAARAAQHADGDWEGDLKALNKAYDAFRKEHGPINDFRVQVRKSTDEEGNVVETPIRIFKNRRLFREDYDASIVTSLETINEAGDIVKAPFLLGRTIGKPVTREVKTIGDALAVSLDETGRLDLDDIARRVGLKRDEAIEALGNQVYKTPQGEWQLADEYLSGDVVAKLDEATDAARLDKSLQRNVEALKAVQPEKLGPSQISVKLGAGWVPARYMTEFAKEIDAGTATYDPKTETWQVEGGNLRSQRKAGAEYGTADRSAAELLEAALNSRPVTIKKRDIDKKEVTDQAATTAANEAIRKIKEKFKSWVWTDAERATDLVEIYNRRYNNIAPRRFDGSHLSLPGVSLRFKLHPHQLRAIWRQVQTGNTYLAHAVGAGKTIEMIAGGMEQKRLGLISKPIYAVPNHMLEQFANEFMELYPLANIMVADDENFSAERRKAFVAAATLNAPDAIIITHSAFERIGVKEESVKPIVEEILWDLEIELDDVGQGDRVRRSQLEQQIEAVRQRFDSIVGAGKKDSTVKFEDIGADMVYVDEAHAFRKLDFATNQKIKGIDPNGSRRALDMYVKTRYLERKRPGRSMVFASGTPVTNTMGELYTIMRFFAPQELDRAGIATFDGWSRQFGEAVAALEANAAGRYEVVERFAKFDNVPELMSRVRQFMDVLTSEHLGALVKRPDVAGGKPNLVVVEATPALKGYMKAVLLPRLEKSRKWKPSKDEPFNPDPVIAITSDGRFAALDPRFFGSKVDASTPTKLTTMGDAIVAEYKATAGNVYTDKAGKNEPVKGSTQIVFYNLGFGEQSQKNRGFNARGALTKHLVDNGVQRDHILWFDDADTDAKKEAMFKAMRSGQARILIGSAKKMGTGVNVQKRLSMLHYFDPPWFPSDVEQPHGRIIRQGNQNPLVRINWYATKGTYDATMWQMVGRKQRFIDQAFTGDKSLRTMEDMSEASQYEQAAAVASGDPRALQLAGLRQDVERLERLQAAHSSEQINVKQALRSAEWGVQSANDRIKTYSAAFKLLGERYVAFNGGQVGREGFEKAGEFGQALKDAFNRKAADHALNPSPEPIDLGEIGRVSIKMHPEFEKQGKPTGEFELVLHVGSYQTGVLTQHALGESVDAAGLTRKLVNALNAIEGNLTRARADLASNETDVRRLSKKLGAPFEYTQELAEKYGDLKRLEEELKAEGEAEAKAAAEAKAPLVIREDGTTGDEPPTTAFSRSAPVGAGVPMRDARAVVASIREALPKAPPIHLHEKASQAPKALLAQIRAVNGERTVHAAFHEGEIHVFPANIGSIEDMQFIVAHHEIRHYGMRSMIGPRLGPVMLEIYNSNKTIKAAADKKMADGLAGSRVEAVEEALADLPVEQVAKMSGFGRLASLLRSWLRAIAAKFRAMGLTGLADKLEPEGWSDADVARFISKAEDISRSGREQYRASGTVFDNAAPMGLAFRRWFGKSKVVDAAGKPLVVYHGTANDITEFQAGVTYFSNADEASHYAENRAEGEDDRHANVVPAYLRIVNPARQEDIERIAAEKGLKLTNPDYPMDFLEDSPDLVRALKAAGYDGAMGETQSMNDMVGARTSYAVFGPEQIKSAVGNTGGFDPGQRDIRFSRAPAAEGEGKREPFDVKGAAGNTLAHYRGMAMQALGRRQIVELWTKDIPPLKAYNDLVQRMDADKNDAGAEADAIATAWGKLKDERALAELMHDATLAKIDPAKPHQATDSSIDYAALRARWDDLSPEARAIYIKARDTYAEHYAKVKDAIRERVERSQMSADKRRMLLEKMDEEFFKATSGVYFPLARFGKYLVLVRDASGKVVSVSRAETVNEADAARKNLLREYPAAKGFKVGKVLKDKEFNARRDGPGKGFMDELYEALESNEASADLFDAVSQLYLASLPDLSWAKHGIHRKGTPGFSQDARRAFAQNVFHGARYLAKLRYADQLQDRLMDMQELVSSQADNEDYDSIKAQQVVDEMVKRHDNLMNPQSNPISTALTSAGFVFHLGLSPASALVNLMQTPMVAYPVMGAKWGFDKAAAALLTASREAAGHRNDLAPVLKGDERAAFDEAVRTGVIDVTMAHDLAGIAQGEDAKVTWKLRPVMKWASFLFHHAEKFNRQVTFMAAYRLARAAGAEHAAAYEQAVDATYKGHFDYSSSNRPRLMQGNWAKVLLLFKQFGQNMVYTLSRQAYLAFKGATPAERAEARKALGGLLVTHAMGAGALGLPLVSTLLAAASWLGGSDDEPWDAEAALQNMLADALGTKAAEVLAHGLSRLTPWDVSGRVGLNQMILPDIREGLEGKDLWESIAVSALGPVAAIAGGTLDGMQQISQGRVTTGLEAMLPAVLRGPVRAFRYGTDGAVDRTGITILDEVSAAGVAGQAIGLSPSEVRHATEGRSAIYRADKALVDRRATLLAIYAKAQMAGDTEGANEAREAIAGFNERNPGRRITPQQIKASIAARRRRIAQADQGVYLPRNRRDALEAGRFAAPE